MHEKLDVYSKKTLPRYKSTFFPKRNSHFVIVFLVATTTVNSLKYYIS